MPVHKMLQVMLMKKISAIFAVIFIFVYGGTAFAYSTSAECCCVMIAETRQVLYARDAEVLHGMASTTKIMTAIIAIENGNLENEVTVSQNAAGQEGSSIYLKAGDKVKLCDLLYGLMLNSGNDAAVAIAEGVGGTTEKFVEMMNDKAREIGCKNTHFENPNGLSSETHYSTAYDMALITAYAMENETFSQIVSTKEYQIKSESSVTYLKNHNKLLWQYDGCVGVKTGFTKMTGRCLVSCAERGGVKIITVTLNDRDDWRDHCQLFDGAFAKVVHKTVISKNERICTRKICGKYVNLLSGSDITVPCRVGRAPRISAKVHLIKDVRHSVSIGTKIGYAEIFAGKHKIGDIDLLCGIDIDADKKNTVLSEFIYLLNKYLP